MCRHFIVVDRAEVDRIAREIERDLAAHEGEFSTLDPLESVEAAAVKDATAAPVPQQPSLFDLAHEQGAPAAEDLRRDAFPSSPVPIIAYGGGLRLSVADLAWGFDAPWKKGPVFNTRIETALAGEGMWAEPFARGRCLVPAWTFFEPHATETVPSARTGRPVKRQYRFSRPDGRPLLIAGVQDGARFSVVTTSPNGAVAPVHDRMPLVLEQDEAVRWLAGDCAALADRSRIALDAAPVC